MRNPIRMLFLLLALLTAVLGSLSSPTVKEAHALICCSACEEDPPPPICRRGCSPSC
ncbi:MAG TPA: hypothetical protein VGG03_07995 [Thermoanaerobaculia bacterium]|jgi:hypothetical protein